MNTLDDYTRKATIERVVDGDTFTCTIDLGLRIYKRVTIRLYGVNCPETKGATKAAGMEAKAFTKDWFAKNKEFLVKTLNLGKEDSFGRLLAEVKGLDGDYLADCLMDYNHAVAYKG